MKGFRCPNCGQAHEMKVGEVIATMDQEMTTVSFQSGEGETLAGFSTGDLATCSECHDKNARKEQDDDPDIKSYTVQDWMDAFAEPLKFFEMEQLCHCGGELWMDLIEGTKNYGFVCDDCGWIKPKQMVSGA